VAAVPPGGNHDPEDLRCRHERLLDALLSGNPDQAEEGVRSHIVLSALPQSSRAIERVTQETQV
jgi:DNA-binding FadR family transcriptional regulator